MTITIFGRFLIENVHICSWQSGTLLLACCFLLKSHCHLLSLFQQLQEARLCLSGLGLITAANLHPLPFLSCFKCLGVQLAHSSCLVLTAGLVPFFTSRGGVTTMYLYLYLSTYLYLYYRSICSICSPRFSKDKLSRRDLLLKTSNLC